MNRVFRRGKREKNGREAKRVSLALLVGFLLFLSLAKEDWIRLATNNWSDLTFIWSDLTFMWSDLTIVWSDLTIEWSELTWNKVTVIPKNATKSDWCAFHPVARTTAVLANLLY